MADGCTDNLLGCCDEPPPPPPLPSGYFAIIASATNFGFNPNPWKKNPSRTRYYNHSFHASIPASCPNLGGPNVDRTVDGTRAVDPVTGVRTSNITGTAGTGIPGKPADQYIIEWTEVVTANSLIMDARYRCAPDAGIVTFHQEYTNGITEADMISRVNELLSQCNFSDFQPNSPAGSYIMKDSGCNGKRATPQPGCLMNTAGHDPLSVCVIPSGGEASWIISNGRDIGDIVDYFANRLLIVNANHNVCIARFDHATGGVSNFAIVDCSPYCEISPPAPKSSDFSNFTNWVGNKGYRNPFQIFPPNTPCP